MSDIVTYDPEERVVYFTGKDEPKEIHRGVSAAEFEEIEKIESYSHDCMATTDRLLHILGKGSIFGAEAREDLQSLKRDVIELYTEFPSYKSVVEESEFERVRGYDGVIYKVKRPLENVFECIGIVADLITNGQLIKRYYLDGHDPYHIQHLIINICAALEHLGIVAVNRLVPEKGGIDASDPQYNVTKVYERILEEGLHEPISDDEDLLDDVSVSEVERLKQMRDLIAHKSLSQNIPSREIPDGLKEQAYLYDGSDAEELTLIALKLQMVALVVLTNYVYDHVKTGIEPYVAAIYQGKEKNPNAAGE
ncbi:hypothetical protein [Halobiforma nitratireducens]|uniref:Uncharacterized protein n=1 Tax=Halobiforma nitratireducens JCM 10879 TaxID=1227454 RepID=M0MNG5_9EURY|nr:hypothetical protein [Halobiforma nitratireducens]EMA46908.1 hypothetical protein C446_00844 [Halobiforma nitratireducens JCM 10879]